MGKDIGIVGAGTAGLHLGLFLRGEGIDCTLYTSRTPDQVRRGRILNTVAHHHVTLERERALGVYHWPAEEYGYFGHHYFVNGERPREFYGRYEEPSRAVDYRIYHPRLMEDFEAMGGKIVYQDVDSARLHALHRLHDLVVVSTGRGATRNLFKRDERESHHDKPLRLLCAGLFRGIRPRESSAVTMYFSPGHGEMIEIPTLSFDGMCTALVIENVPDGELAGLSRQSYAENPRAFLDNLMRSLEEHYSPIMERLDPAEFDLAGGASDLLQGGFTPTVRVSHIRQDDDRVIPTLGDVHALVDPMTGQGANLASHAAWVMGEAIRDSGVFDRRFMEQVDGLRNERIFCANRWTNYLLSHLVDMPTELQNVFEALESSQSMRDEFTDNFNYPERQWNCFASPARMHQWAAMHTVVPASATAPRCCRVS
ncbi:MAG: monooxygenase [Salinisphaeraceae bacterium]|nr:monooxygenase [Salinisphaeraceae bacterium]